MTRFILPASLFIAGLALCYWFTTSVPDLSNLGLFYSRGSDSIILSQGVNVLLFFWKALLGLGLALTALLSLPVVEWSKQLGVEDADNLITRLKTETAQAKHQAATANQNANAKLANEYNRLESLQNDAERKLEESLAIRAEADKKLSAVVTEARKKLSESNSKVQDASTKKEHASAAMQRHKRKLDSLKNDYSALIKFAKQYHPEHF